MQSWSSRLTGFPSGQAPTHGICQDSANGDPLSRVPRRRTRGNVRVDPHLRIRKSRSIRSLTRSFCFFFPQYCGTLRSRGRKSCKRNSKNLIICLNILNEHDVFLEYGTSGDVTFRSLFSALFLSIKVSPKVARKSSG